VSKLNVVLEALSRGGYSPRSVKGGYQARCPMTALHNNGDKHPSLSIGEGQTQPVIMTCFGCHSPAADILAALGLTLADICANGAKASYAYSDNLLKTRHARNGGGKDYYQWTTLEKDGVSSGRSGAIAPFYRQELIAEAKRLDRPIWVCEGESDTDTLIGLGHLAVSPPDGAGSFNDEHGVLFAGLRVNLIPDDDDAGRNMMATASEAIRPFAKSLTLLRPTRGNDVREHIEAGGDVAEFEDVAVAFARAAHEAAVAREATKERIRTEGRARAADDAASEDPRLLEALDSGRFVADTKIRPVEWRIDQLLPVNGRALVVAAKKTGKTTLTVALMRALTSTDWVGGNFMGRFPCSPIEMGNIGLLSFEMPDEMMHDWIRRGGVNPNRVMVWPLRGRTNPLASTVGRSGLAKRLSDGQCTLLIIDTFSKAFIGFGDENDNGAVNTWCAAVDEMAAEAGVSEIVVNHHANAGGRQSRGATALPAWPDSVWYLHRSSVGREDDEGGADPRIFHAETRAGDIEAEITTFDPDTLNVRMSGQTYSQWKLEAKGSAIWDVVHAGMDGVGGRSRNDIARIIRSSGQTIRDEDLAVHLARWETDGQVVRHTPPGKRWPVYHLP